MRSGRSVVIAAGILGLLACGGPQLRSPNKIKPSEVREECHGAEGGQISEEQAVCIARLAGLNVADEMHTIRSARAVNGEAVWVVEERCNDQNPRCIAISIRERDGEIVNTRYLYVALRHGPDFSGKQH